MKTIALSRLPQEPYFLKCRMLRCLGTKSIVRVQKDNISAGQCGALPIPPTISPALGSTSSI